MRIRQILENTTAGSVATLAMPLMTQTRESVDVPGLKPVQQVIKGKVKKKGPYANSIVESKVTEDDLAEQDLIVIPGQGRLKRTGFVKHDLDQGDHEGETLKNSLHTIIRVATHLDKRLSLQSEFPEWVSEKIGAVKSNMVTVMDYLISSQEMQHDPDEINELSSDLLQKAAQAAKDRSNKAMDPEIHNALGGGYMNPLAKHYDNASQKMDNRAAQVRKKETIQKIASPAVMRKIGMNEGEKDTSRMNKQHQDFYNTNPNFKRDDREVKSVGGRLATKVTPKTAQVIKKPMTPFESLDNAWDAAKKKVSEGSAPKEKQKTPYRDINGPEYKIAADKQKEKMAKDKAAEPGKKLADKIVTKKK